MQREVIFAGFGGQGILLAGQLLAYTGMEQGYNVVWLPSYGPEMRGGTANCTVVISDTEIASPIIPDPGASVVMNNPSLERFGPKVRPGGLVIINSSLINISLGRDDVTQLFVPANEIAIERGSGRAANMVVLGAYVAATQAVSFQALKESVKVKFESKPQFIDINLSCLEAGRTLALELLEKQGKGNG